MVVYTAENCPRTREFTEAYSKRAQQYGWEPSVSLEEGLRNVYEWAESELEENKQKAVADVNE